MIRIILDTNLWISFLITKNLSGLDKLLFDGKIQLVFSEELLNEFITVSGRPKLKKYFSKADLIDILKFMDTYAELVIVKSKVDLCRDPKDNFLLSLAIDSNADFLLTGDKDLLSLKKIGKTKIIRISKYFDL